MPRTKRAPKPILPLASEAEVTKGMLKAAGLFGQILRRQNVMVSIGASGKPVASGMKGDTDWGGTVHTGPNRGRTLGVEIKKEGFNHLGQTGEKLAHWNRQVANMRSINASGGLAFWAHDAAIFASVFDRIFSKPGLEIDMDENGSYDLVWDD